MYNGLSWTLLLVLQFLVVISHPIQTQNKPYTDIKGQLHENENSESNSNEQIISVRITSSVAVGQQKGKVHTISHNHENKARNNRTQNYLKEMLTTTPGAYGVTYEIRDEEIPPDLIGANIEFIKQLNAKKLTKSTNPEHIHPFQSHVQGHSQPEDIREDPVSDVYPMDDLENDDSELVMTEVTLSPYEINTTETETIYPDDITTTTPFPKNPSRNEEILEQASTRLVADIEEDISLNHGNIRNNSTSNFNNKRFMSEGKRPRNFSRLNDGNDTVAESSINSFTYDNSDEDFESYNDEENVPRARSAAFPQKPFNYKTNSRKRPIAINKINSRLTTVNFSVIHDTLNKPLESKKQYDLLNKPYVTELPKVPAHPIVYSEPAKIYSEPAKFYSEPAKFYSEPAKVYSEPSKIYSEPAKVYSEPSKFYSQPASLFLPDPLQVQTPSPTVAVDIAANNMTSKITNPHSVTDYEEEENDSNTYVNTNGQSHSVQETSTEKCQQDNCKVGYVVEGRQFKKYRVEERTPDGFIVGEYGVVRNEDGALRGVRYTADSDASPRLIHDALMKFLQLK